MLKQLQCASWNVKYLKQNHHQGAWKCETEAAEEDLDEEEVSPLEEEEDIEGDPLLSPTPFTWLSSLSPSFLLLSL